MESEKHQELLNLQQDEISNEGDESDKGSNKKYFKLNTNSQDSFCTSPSTSSKTPQVSASVQSLKSGLGKGEISDNKKMESNISDVNLELESQGLLCLLQEDFDEDVASDNKTDDGCKESKSTSKCLKEPEDSDDCIIILDSDSDTSSQISNSCQSKKLTKTVAVSKNRKQSSLASKDEFLKQLNALKNSTDQGNKQDKLFLHQQLQKITSLIANYEARKPEEVAEWREIWNNKEILVVGDSRAKAFTQINEADTKLPSYHLFTKDRASLKEVVALANQALTEYPNAEFLVLFSFHCDLTRLPATKSKHGNLIVPTKVDLKELLCETALATSQWQKRYPKVLIFWPLPYTPDFFAYNRQCLAKKGSTFKLNECYMAKHSQEYAEMVMNLKEMWSDHFSSKPLILSSIHCKTEGPIVGPTLDGLHPNANTVFTFWNDFFREVKSFYDSRFGKKPAHSSKASDPSSHVVATVREGTGNDKNLSKNTIDELPIVVQETNKEISSKNRKVELQTVVSNFELSNRKSSQISSTPSDTQKEQSNKFTSSEPTIESSKVESTVDPANVDLTLESEKEEDKSKDKEDSTKKSKTNITVSQKLFLEPQVYLKECFQELKKKIEDKVVVDDTQEAPQQIPGWREIWHSKESLVVGDSRAKAFTHINETETKLSNYHLFTKNRASLKEVVALADKALTEYPNAEFLVLFSFHCDLTSVKQRDDNRVLVPSKVDLKQAICEAALATSRWQKEHPKLAIFWPLPYTPDFLRYNTQCLTKKKTYLGF